MTQNELRKRTYQVVANTLNNEIRLIETRPEPHTESVGPLLEELRKIADIYMRAGDAIAETQKAGIP